MAWTPEQEDRLRVLIAEGCSSSEVAATLNKEFGVTYERNAVIGKRHRMGLSAVRKQGFDDAHKERRIRQKRLAIRAVVSAPVVVVVPVPIAVRKQGFDDAQELDPQTNCSLMELTSSTCRWPVGDDIYTYCGAPTEKPPYCSHHTVVGTRQRM